MLKQKEIEFKLPRIITFLFKLSCIESKHSHSFHSFGKYLGYSTPQPDIIKLLNILKQKNILIINDKTYNNYNKYKINIKLLRKMIEEQEFYKYFYNYIVNKNSFWGLYKL